MVIIIKINPNMITIKMLIIASYVYRTNRHVTSLKTRMHKNASYIIMTQNVSKTKMSFDGSDESNALREYGSLL